jgi:hypothetical protein
MEDKKYNGWTNYETWLFNVNVTNDQETYNYVQEVADSCNDSTIDFKEAMEEMFYNEEKDLYEICDRWLERDWQEINFYEIMQSLKGYAE